MNAERMVGQDEPLMIAWNAYKATEEYANSRQWAEYKAHLDGSLWEEEFKRGETDDDYRFGCLSFGFIQGSKP